ncbi:hypothetical protein [Bradyrhizobium sp. AS23.2]|uniref:hypothetical protein n=1 Tax=Bradyrhizobium sp. AS23.2 TaxID=1680155 RepID=UPI00093C32DC|nr:hypothetical protein [Bradyrhizobium sp. AS23.2]OKO86184.1 hypothetical protein AC630_03895 [Bradyrhizobium sp. AS23.2]
MNEHSELFDSNIASMTKFYESTGNVAAAWCAFSIAFTHGREIPDSIFREIERFAAEVALTAEKAITAEVDKGPVTLTPEELGTIWRGKDKRDPVGRLQREWRDYQLYWEMRNRVNRGSTVAEAAKAVRAMRGVALSERSLENLWRRLDTDG